MSSFSKQAGVFKASVAAIALAATMIGAPLTGVAQDAEAPAAAAGATQGAAETLPQVLQDLNLKDVKIRERRGGKAVKGELADGTEIRAFVDDQGEVRGIFADDDAALPQALVERMVPEAVRGQEIFGQLATISGIFADERGVMVAGGDAAGDDIRAGFSADGTLMRFGRGDDMGGEHMRGGKEGWGHKDDHREDRRGRDDDRRGHDRHGERDHRGEGRPAALNDDAVRKALSDAGYTDLGEIERQGPRAVVAAKNPQGEAVRVELSPKGEVMRESAQ